MSKKFITDFYSKWMLCILYNASRSHTADIIKWHEQDSVILEPYNLCMYRRTSVCRSYDTQVIELGIGTCRFNGKTYHFRNASQLFVV